MDLGSEDFELIRTGTYGDQAAPSADSAATPETKVRSEENFFGDQSRNAPLLELQRPGLGH